MQQDCVGKKILAPKQYTEGRMYASLESSNIERKILFRDCTSFIEVRISHRKFSHDTCNLV